MADLSRPGFVDFVFAVGTLTLFLLVLTLLSGNICHASDSPVLVWSYFSCNIITDLYILSIPVPILMRSSLTPKQRLGLLALFGCTILITVMAVARVVLINTVSVCRLSQQIVISYYSHGDRGF